MATPNLDALAKESIVYDHAYSHCPLTLPSHASLLTGLLPGDIGVHDNLGFKLDPAKQTLAEAFKRKGWATGAAVSAYVLRGETGIDRGFDFFDDRIARHADEALGGIQRNGNETEAAAEKWIEAQGDKPFFFFLHLYEPHAPYDAPEPFRSRYKPYDAEIASADAIAGKFIDALKRLGRYDSALIVFLSDHGEGLGDHGEDEHGIFLYREAIQVPLFVKLAGAKSGSRIQSPIGLSEVMPAILAGSFAESKTPRQIYSETYYPRLHFGWSDLHSLIDGRSHYIEAPRPELYDVASDPAEKANRIDSDRRTYFAMKAALAPLRKDVTAPERLDPEEAAKLAALGYLGSASVQPGEALADPKDKVSTFRTLRAAFASFRAGKNQEALTQFQQILRENPRMTDVWDVTAKAQARLGHRAEAIAAAKEGLRSNPRSSVLALTVADLALEAGQLDEAQKHAELALKDDPARAHEALARVFLARGELERAEGEARQATGSGDRAAALVTLARVQKARNLFEAALASADEAQRIIASEGKPPYAGLSYLRGDLLARLGRPEEAEAALKQEIALSPADHRAYQTLIILYASEGRAKEATALVYQLINAAPTPQNYAAVVQTLRTLGDEQGARYWEARSR